MLRLRDARGEIIPLPVGAMFVEIGDIEGNVAVVVYKDPKDDTVLTITKESPRAKSYSKMYGARFVDITDQAARATLSKGS